MSHDLIIQSSPLHCIASTLKYVKKLIYQYHDKREAVNVKVHGLGFCPAKLNSPTEYRQIWIKWKFLAVRYILRRKRKLASLESILIF